MTSRNLRICQAVAKVFRRNAPDLWKRTRARLVRQGDIALARNIAMTICFEREVIWSAHACDIAVAKEFGAHRATVRYARQRIAEARKAGDAITQALILRCEEAVRRLDGK